MTSHEILKRYGGSWDGGLSEIHGQIESRKFELLRRPTGDWLLSVFERGECVYSAKGAIEELLESCPLLEPK